ncbi:hypothetical protein [Hydrogenophaga intermedia]|uniref:hypothetical protein n=1 Tax=Hydrogenophaga intermedia TaxID=65786 RepID=UPI002044A44D|nr:hypothetical protein [Hydrogenophaga intermedia]MCM3565191.1 hypothetical protein [Hydrogenophaga intermedia]
MTTPREREREEVRASWNDCVERLVGPAVGADGRNERRDNCLHLAAAALRAAGQVDLAAKAEALAR